MTIATVLSLLLSTACIIAGTSMTWHVYRTTAVTSFTSTSTEAERSSFQYWNLCFVFPLLVSWWHFFAERSPKKSGSDARIFLFYGFFFFEAVQSKSSWKIVDDYRYSVGNETLVPAANPSVGVFSYEESRKLLAGAILNYFGVFLLASFFHGSPRFHRSICAYIGLFFYVSAVAMNIAGIVILWNLQTVWHSNVVSLTGPIARDFVFTQITVPQTYILLILGGSMFSMKSEGASAAMVFMAGYGTWYLVWGYALQYLQETDQIPLFQGTTNWEYSKTWAGSLMCWISAWSSIMAAQFIAIHHENIKDVGDRSVSDKKQTPKALPNSIQETPINPNLQEVAPPQPSVHTNRTESEVDESAPTGQSNEHESNHSTQVDEV